MECLNTWAKKPSMILFDMAEQFLQMSRQNHVLNIKLITEFWLKLINARFSLNTKGVCKAIPVVCANRSSRVTWQINNALHPTVQRQGDHVNLPRMLLFISVTSSLQRHQKTTMFCPKSNTIKQRNIAVVI